MGTEMVTVRMTRAFYETLCRLDESFDSDTAPFALVSPAGISGRAEGNDSELVKLARAGYGKPKNVGKIIQFREGKSHTCFACDYVKSDGPPEWCDEGRLADYPVLDSVTGRPTGRVVKRMICERHREMWC